MPMELYEAQHLTVRGKSPDLEERPDAAYDTHKEVYCYAHEHCAR